MTQPVWWSARVTLFTINRLNLNSGVCTCILFTVSIANSEPTFQHPELTVYLAFILLMQKAVNWVLFVLNVFGYDLVK